MQLDLVRHRGRHGGPRRGDGAARARDGVGDAATAVFLAAAGPERLLGGAEQPGARTDKPAAERAITTARDLLERMEDVERRVRQLLAQRVP